LLNGVVNGIFDIPLVEADVTTSRFDEDLRAITDFKVRAADRAAFIEAVRLGALAAANGDLHAEQEASKILASIGK
jgi:hypothetical protein